MSSGGDYYKTLGVQRDATLDQIKAAYRKLAMQYHPDRNKSPEAEEKFKEITEAYAVLSDEQKRRQYDAYGSAGIHNQYTQEDLFRGVDFDDIFRGFGFNLNDVFGDFFGSNVSRQRRATGDIRVDVEVTMQEVYTGVEKEVQIEREVKCKTCNGTGAKPGTSTMTCPTCNGTGQVRKVQSMGFASFVRIEPCPRCHGSGRIIGTPCPTCHGSGHIRSNERLKVRIPAGIDDGDELRVKGEGNYVNGRNGDLYVIVHTLPQPGFRREGPDLYASMDLDFVDAVLGTTVYLNGVNGERIELKVPEGTQHGSVMRLKGKGLPKVNGFGKGNLYITVNVSIPRSLNSRQRELLVQFKNAGR
ncbi:MAG: molecular chaperone DnaJ [Nitrososphaerota archaeon]|nr:molecular chaperone DnaJ [Nitrososphaerota archaeon]